MRLFEMLDVLITSGLVDALGLGAGVLIGVAVLVGVLGNDVPSEADAEFSVGWDLSFP